jgi:hypothetical protein
MNLESIKLCWREESNFQPPVLEEGSVRRMIETRATDIQRELRSRLRREAGYYLPMMAVAVTSLLGGLTLNRALAACSMALILGAVIATLWRAERRIEDTPLELSLRDALTRLLTQVDAAGQAYVAVYVALFIVTGVAVTGFVLWRHGAGGLLVATLLASTVVVSWSLWSGHRYVERMLRRYRSELAECLRQLEEER